MPVHVKICGVKTEGAIGAAVEGDVSFLGFNFYPPSPRFLTPEAAAALAPLVPASVKKVALFVNADDDTIARTLGVFPADMLQLHGDETPARVEDIKKKFALPIIKALPVSSPDDLKKTAAYPAAAFFLFDAKPPDHAPLPGGNALRFDWALLKNRTFEKPWFLAGGIHTDNVRDAIRQSGAQLIDVASGVERTRGEKDPALIRTFLQFCKTL